MWKLLVSFDILKDFAGQTGLSLRSGPIVLVVSAVRQSDSWWWLFHFLIRAFTLAEIQSWKWKILVPLEKKWNGILTVKILLILCINFSFSRIIKDVNSLYKKMPNTEYLVWSGFEAFLAFGRASGNPEESSEILSEDRLSFKTLINHHCYETFMPDLCLLSLISSTLHFPAHIHKY